MRHRITLEVTAFGIKHSVILRSDASANEFIERCVLLAEAIRYPPQLVREALTTVREKFE